MQPVQLEGLRMVVKRFIDDGAKANIKRWNQAVELTACRAGLIVSGDLEIAKKILGAEQQLPGRSVGRRQDEGAPALLRERRVRARPPGARYRGGGVASAHSVRSASRRVRREPSARAISRNVENEAKPADERVVKLAAEIFGGVFTEDAHVELDERAEAEILDGVVVAAEREMRPIRCRRSRAWPMPGRSPGSMLIAR